MAIEKKNVSVFNANVQDNGGYEYTTNAPLSSRLANKRMSDAVIGLIPKSAKTLVDMGCGDGAYTIEFKQHRPDLKVEGFDPAADAVHLAQKKYPEITFKVLNILEQDIEKHSSQFDVGVVRGVLHHLTDQELAIKNAMKLSKTVIILEPNGNNPILKWIEKNSQYHRDHEEQSFTSKQLVEWCKKIGGKNIKLDYIGFVPFFFPAFLSRVIHFFQPLLEKIPVIRSVFSAQIVIVFNREN